MSWQTADLLKVVVATLAGGTLVVLYFLQANGRIAAKSRALSAFAGVLAVAGAAAYFNFGYFHGTKYPYSVHYYDFYHYFIGAKYYRELGYKDLYAATVIADDEGDKLFSRLSGFKHIRDLRADKVIPWQQAFKERDRIKAVFTVKRWQEFVNDIRYLEAQMPSRHWKEALRDFGFNGPPVWALLAGLVAQFVPIAHVWQVVFLAWLDILLMAISFAFVYKAFGARAVVLGIVLFGVNYCQRYHCMSGSYFRLDWLAALMIGISLVRMGRPGAAGALLAYSALLRIFPVIYFAGPCVRAGYHLIRYRRLPVPEVRFLAGGALAGAVLVACTCLRPEGIVQWRAFLEDIVPHSQKLTVKRYAITYLFTYDGALSSADIPDFEGVGAWDRLYQSREARLARYAWAVWTIRVAVLAAFVWAGMRLSLYESIALGVVLVFFFSNPVRYYWAQLLVLVPLLVPRIGQSQALGAIISLFSFFVLMYAINMSTGFYNLQQFVICLVLTLLFAYLLAWLSFRPVEEPVRREKWAGVSAEST